jgi:DNA polymerase-3 subunit delta
MQVRAEQLASHLSQATGRGGLHPLYTLWGDEPLQLMEAAEAVRSAARAAGHTERQVHTVSGAHFAWEVLLGESQAMSLFAERQLVEIRIPSGKPGKDGSEALQRYCASPSAQRGGDVLTLIQLPRLDRQQQQSAWFTALDAAGVTVRIDPIERPALPAWIARRLQAQGQTLEEGEAGRAALQLFADRVEGNLLAAHQEVLKLGLLYPQGTLTAEHIEACVVQVARFDVFKLSETVWSGQVERLLRMLDGLASEGEATVLVHWALCDDIRSLWRIQQALEQGKPLPMALREARVWGVKERLFERLAPRLKAECLQGWLLDAHQCDGVIKGLPHPRWPKDPWAALRVLALRLCSAQNTAIAPLG